MTRDELAARLGMAQTVLEVAETVRALELYRHLWLARGRAGAMAMPFRRWAEIPPLISFLILLRTRAKRSWEGGEHACAAVLGGARGSACLASLAVSEPIPRRTDQRTDESLVVLSPLAAWMTAWSVLRMRGTFQAAAHCRGARGGVAEEPPRYST